VLFLCCPVFSYLGVMAVEAGMVDIKDLRPVFLRLLPSFQEQVATLPARRAELQKELRAIVKKYGPELGSLYFDEDVKWDVVKAKFSADCGSGEGGALSDSGKFSKKDKAV